MSARGGASAFSPRVVLGLLLFGAVAFLATLYLVGMGPSTADGKNGGGHAAGTGLNGYAALADLLEAQGYQVSRIRNQGQLDDHNLLILTPPQYADGAELAKIVFKRRHTGPTIVVLPKWGAFPVGNVPGMDTKRGWVMLGPAQLPDWSGFHDEISVNLVASKAAKGEPDWRGGGLSGKLPDPRNVLAGHGPNLEPLVTGADGTTILAAYVNDGGVYPALEDMADTPGSRMGENDGTYPLVMVFEPDLMDNYGMADRSRAAIALEIVKATADGEAMPVAFDLTLNGLGRSANLLTLAFTPPFLAATLCLLIAALVVGWRAFRRFGPPLAELPDLAFGKRQLAANGAALIQRSGRIHLLGAPYAALLRARVARLLGLRQGQDGEQTEAEIDRLLAARGFEPTFAQNAGALRRARTPHDLLRPAHALKQIERMLAR